MYITAAAATAILQGEGSVEDWPADATEQGRFIERASRRIDQLAFAPAHETPLSPRYTDGYLTDAPEVDDNAIPHNLAVLVALLALWYAQNPNGFYNRSPAGEESLCKQMSDMPLSIQTGLWAFVSDEVKIDADELPASKQDRQAGGSLYPANPQSTPAFTPASPESASSPQGPGIDQQARELAQRALDEARDTEQVVDQLILEERRGVLKNLLAGVTIEDNPITQEAWRVIGTAKADNLRTDSIAFFYLMAEVKITAKVVDGKARTVGGITLTMTVDSDADGDTASGRFIHFQPGSVYLQRITGSTATVQVVGFGQFFAETAGVLTFNIWARAESNIDISQSYIKGVRLYERIDSAKATDAAVDTVARQEAGRAAAAAAKNTAALAALPTPPAKATNTDVDGEAEDTKYTTVTKVFRAIARKVKAASTTVAGLIEIATAAEADAGSDTKRAMTPALVKRLIDKIRPLLLPAFPAAGSRDNKVAKFDGDTLKWETDSAEEQSDTDGEIIPYFFSAGERRLSITVIKHFPAGRTAILPTNRYHSQVVAAASGKVSFSNPENGFKVEIWKLQSLGPLSKVELKSGDTTITTYPVDMGHPSFDKMGEVEYNNATYDYYVSDFLFSNTHDPTVLVADGGVAVQPLFDRVLPGYPAAGSRDNKVAKFDGDTLKWERSGVEELRASLDAAHHELDAIEGEIVVSYRNFKPWPIVNTTTGEGKGGYGLAALSSVSSAETVRGSDFRADPQIASNTARFIVLRVPLGVDQKGVNVKITRNDNNTDLETTSGAWKLLTDDNTYNYYVLRNAANDADRKLTAVAYVRDLRLQVGERAIEFAGGSVIEWRALKVRRVKLDARSSWANFNVPDGARELLVTTKNSSRIAYALLLVSDLPAARTSVHDVGIYLDGPQENDLVVRIVRWATTDNVAEAYAFLYNSDNSDDVTATFFYR